MVLAASDLLFFIDQNAKHETLLACETYVDIITPRTQSNLDPFLYRIARNQLFEQ